MAGLSVWTSGEMSGSVAPLRMPEVVASDRPLERRGYSGLCSGRHACPESRHAAAGTLEIAARTGASMSVRGYWRRGCN